MIAFVTGLGLQACASGGGGGMSPSTPTTPTTPTSPQTPAYYETAEYFSQYGLRQMNVSHAYHNGGFGQGITIAVIDSGIDSSFRELQGREHPDSTSIWEEQGGTLGDYGSSHGTAIGAVIAAARDGFGMQGVAPDVSLLDIRVDRGVPNTELGGSFPYYTETDLALSIDYAITHGANIISLSLARPPSAYENGGADIYAALRRAVDAGLLVTIGTANYTGDTPIEDRVVGDWIPVSFAEDPAMRGQIVVVPALNSNDELADFSARAGRLAEFAISAAGADIYVRLDGNAANIVNGVSFSGPHIAGALALMMSAFPNLTGPEALEILYDTARDLGEPGIDDIYGHGVPDFAEAFAPQGQTNIKSAGSEWRTDIAALTTAPSGAFGDWVWQTELFDDAVFLDRYDRLYSVANQLERRRPTRMGIDAFEAAAEAGMTPARVTRIGQSGHVALRQPDPAYNPYSQLDSEMTRPTSALSLTYREGDLEVSAGRGFAAPPTLTGIGQPVLAPSAFTGQTFALGSGAAWSSARWQSDRFGLVVRNSGTQAQGARSAAFTWAFGEQTLAFELGSISERHRALGGALARRFGAGDQSDSHFQALNWVGALPAGWQGAARLEVAHADPALPAGMTLTETPVATAWTLAAERSWMGGALGLTLAQPLRAERGRVTTRLAVDIDADWNLIHAERSGSLTPSGREMSAELAYRRSLFGADLALAARYTSQPFHVESARDNLALWLGFQSRY